MSLFSGKSKNQSGVVNKYDLSVPESIFAIALAAAAADGQILESEIQTIAGYLSRMNLFSRFNDAEINVMMQKISSILRQIGPLAMVEAVKDNIPNNLLATAFTFAVDITLVDGEYSEEEQEFIENLRKKLNISRSDANEIIRVMLVKNRG